MTDKIEALREKAPLVKPLEWDTAVMPPFESFARTSIGTYRVHQGRTPGSGWWSHFNGMMGDEGHATEEEAQQEAQADYEQRIASALNLSELDRLRSSNEPMADGGETLMTAAEEVLAWLLIEKIGSPDDVAYSPDQAQEIITARLDELSRLRSSNEAMRKALETADAAIAYYIRYLDGGEMRGSYDGKPERDALRRASYATRAALSLQEEEAR